MMDLKRSKKSIELCKIAVNDGIKKIVATPHSKDGVYEAKSDEILETVEALNLKLKENRQIDIRDTARIRGTHSCRVWWRV